MKACIGDKLGMKFQAYLMAALLLKLIVFRSKYSISTNIKIARNKKYRSLIRGYTRKMMIYIGIGF